MMKGLHLRALRQNDAPAALSLYNDLTFGPKSQDEGSFQTVLSHPGTTIFGAILEDELVAMLTLHILPNVTWGARPYALVENVITREDHRRRGIGKQLMEHAVATAWDANAYKVMLLTGKKRGAAGFYSAAGFSAEDKTAMVIRQPDT